MPEDPSGIKISGATKDVEMSMRHQSSSRSQITHPEPSISPCQSQNQHAEAHYECVNVDRDQHRQQQQQQQQKEANPSFTQWIQTKWAFPHLKDQVLERSRDVEANSDSGEVTRKNEKESHDDFGPSYKDQTRNRSIAVGADLPNFRSTFNGPHFKDQAQSVVARRATISSVPAVVGDEAESREPLDCTHDETGLRFKHQVRSMIAEEVEQIQASSKRTETSSNNVAEDDFPTVPAIRLNDSNDDDNDADEVVVALLREDVFDIESAIQLRYEGPTKEEVCMLRNKVLELQSQLREQDEMVRKLRISLESTNSANDGKGEGKRQHHLHTRRYLLVFGGLLCVVALGVGLGFVFVGKDAAATDVLLGETAEPLAPVYTVAPSIITATAAPSAHFAPTEPSTPEPTNPITGAEPSVHPTDPPISEPNASTESVTSGVISAIVVSCFLGLLFFGCIIYRWKTPVFLANTSKVEAGRAGTQENTAAALEAKLKDRSETAKQLKAILQKLHVQEE